MTYLTVALLAVMLAYCTASDAVKEHVAKKPVQVQYAHPGLYGGYPGYGAPFFPFWHSGIHHGPMPYYQPYYHPQAPNYYRPQPGPYGGQEMKFRGKFTGTCKDAYDGLYFVDERSFAYCSAGVKTVQACAEGSANPSYEDFIDGKYKYFYDFCSINLAANHY